MLKHTQHAMPAPHAMPARRVVVQSADVKNVKRIVTAAVLIPFILVFVGIAATVVCVVHKVKKTADHITHNISKSTTTTTTTNKSSSSDTSTKTRTRVRWVDYAEAASAKINADDVHDFVGVAYYSSENNATYVIGVDGDTREHIWKAGPFGDTDVQAMSNTHFAVVGDQVLVTDHKSMVRVLDLATGKEKRATALTDRGEWMCPHPTDTDRVWIEVSDKNNVWLTLSTGALAKQKKHPKHCMEWSERTECREIGAARCISNRRNKKFRQPKGTSMGAAMRDGEHFVAYGHKQPGTSHTMLAGLDKTGKKTKWVRRLIDTNDTADVTGEPEFLDLAGGVVYAYYEAGRDNHHMIAIDAETGETKWDIDLPGRDKFDPDPEKIIASPTRVFVMAGEVVYVFDVAAGKLLGHVGDRW
jgi:outer membrane protein assembly factor BamB